MAAPTDARWFREALGQYPTGVCVVTATLDDGARAGFVVGSFTSVSLDPPLVAFFPDKSSTSWPKIASTGSFCANILNADQEHLCRQFAAQTEDKFTGVSVRTATTGSPIIEGVVALAGDVQAAAVVLKTSDRRSRLLGLEGALSELASQLRTIVIGGGLDMAEQLRAAALGRER